MKKKVIQKGAKILITPCKVVKDFKSAQQIVKDLEDTINFLKTKISFHRGIGLAAPQIGKSVCISVAENAKEERYILINPQIIKASKLKAPIREGCISFLKYRAMVPRYKSVTVKALDKNGKEYIIKAKGDFAMLLQHEIDHLQGVLMFEHLPHKEKDLFFVGSVL